MALKLPPHGQSPASYYYMPAPAPVSIDTAVTVGRWVCPTKSRLIGVVGNHSAAIAGAAGIGTSMTLFSLDVVLTAFTITLPEGTPAGANVYLVDQVEGPTYEPGDGLWLYNTGQQIAATPNSVFTAIFEAI